MFADNVAHNLCCQIRADNNLINMYFYDGGIDGASVTMILCLHVLIACRILLVLDMLIVFSEYRCLKR